MPESLEDDGSQVELEALVAYRPVLARLAIQQLRQRPQGRMGVEIDHQGIGQGTDQTGRHGVIGQDETTQPPAALGGGRDQSMRIAGGEGDQDRGIEFADHAGSRHMDRHLPLQQEMELRRNVGGAVIRVPVETSGEEHPDLEAQQPDKAGERVDFGGRRRSLEDGREHAEWKGGQDRTPPDDSAGPRSPAWAIRRRVRPFRPGP